MDNIPCFLEAFKCRKASHAFSSILKLRPPNIVLNDRVKAPDKRKTVEVLSREDPICIAWIRVHLFLVF